MKCKKQPKYFKLPIVNLWEVHLDRELWNRVVLVAHWHRCSFSWITRYCVFRLVRKKNLYMRKAMEIHSKNVRLLQKNTLKHRHLMCLYGDDEKLLRMAAMELGITVSHMIRIALHWFLKKIEQSITKWEHIYYHGTKICSHLIRHRTNILKMPDNDRLKYIKWNEMHWWNRPPITIVIPYK